SGTHRRSDKGRGQGRRIPRDRQQVHGRKRGRGNDTGGLGKGRHPRGDRNEKLSRSPVAIARGGELDDRVTKPETWGRYEGREQDWQGRGGRSTSGQIQGAPGRYGGPRERRKGLFEHPVVCPGCRAREGGQPARQGRASPGIESDEGREVGRLRRPSR